LDAIKFIVSVSPKPIFGGQHFLSRACYVLIMFLPISRAFGVSMDFEFGFTIHNSY